MLESNTISGGAKAAEDNVAHFQNERGPFVVATEKTRMAMVFTSAKDSNNTVVFANDSFLRLSGFAREEVLGQNFNVLITQHGDGEGIAHIEAAFRKSSQLEPDSEVETQVLCCRKDGSQFWASLFVNPVHDDNGTIVQYFASLINISTYREHLETQVRMQELQSEVFHTSRFTVMGEMAANMAHELNQPLTAVVNYLKGADRILERMEGPQVPMFREALNAATGQALRAGNLIRHLREFVARGDSDRAVEELQGLVEDAAHLALMGAKDSGVEVAFEFTHRAPSVLANRTQIQQILLNLIRNAVEAMEHAGKGTLVIKTEDFLLESMVRVSVVDTGPGIAPEVLGKLFTPFTTTKKTGMGIGLSICRTIIEAHGGRIWVESLPGNGSAFHFTLGTVEKGENPDDLRRPVCQAAEVQRQTVV